MAGLSDSHRIHIGLGTARKIDRLEVRWPQGQTEAWTNLATNQIWDITEGDREAQSFVPRVRDRAAPKAPAPLDKAGLLRFWERQHAAMDAMKREHDFGKAAALFREALVLNPEHEDSHYYLANCLVSLGDIRSAITELDVLVRINPQNHRAFQRKGELLAAAASSRSQLEEAREALDAARHLNSEETGTLVLREEVSLAMRDFASADQDFAHACQTNPRAVNARFLRGFIDWKRGNLKEASAKLKAAPTHADPNGSPPVRHWTAMCDSVCSASPVFSTCLNRNGTVPRIRGGRTRRWTRISSACAELDLGLPGTARFLSERMSSTHRPGRANLHRSCGIRRRRTCPSDWRYHYKE